MLAAYIVYQVCFFIFPLRTIIHHQLPTASKVVVVSEQVSHTHARTHTHTPRLTALFPGLPGWAGTRKVKPIWILLKQETVSGSGISWAYASLHLAPDR